jgi:hypothetical protein
MRTPSSRRRAWRAGVASTWHGAHGVHFLQTSTPTRGARPALAVARERPWVVPRTPRPMANRARAPLWDLVSDLACAALLGF